MPIEGKLLRPSSGQCRAAECPTIASTTRSPPSIAKGSENAGAPAPAADQCPPPPDNAPARVGLCRNHGEIRSLPKRPPISDHNSRQIPSRRCRCGPLNRRRARPQPFKAPRLPPRFRPPQKWRLQHLWLRLSQDRCCAQHAHLGRAIWSDWESVRTSRRKDDQMPRPRNDFSIRPSSATSSHPHTLRRRPGMIRCGSNRIASWRIGLPLRAGSARRDRQAPSRRMAGIETPKRRRDSGPAETPSTPGIRRRQAPTCRSILRWIRR